MDVESHIKEKLKKAGIKNVRLEVPPKKEFGDYSFTCFDIAKKEKKAPQQIAKELSEKIKKDDIVSEIKVFGGYVNFYINYESIAKDILKKANKKNYGGNKTKKKALIEHTSINPNASPHVGRARNALIGDAVARTLKFYGYKTDIHYFVNDVGKQIAMLVLAAKRTEKKVTFENLLDMYIKINAEMITNVSLEKKVFELLEKLENGDKETIKLFEKISKIAVKGQVKIFNELGIKYDYFDYESKYVKSRKLTNILKKFKKNVFADKEGRQVLNLDGYDLPLREPVLVLTRANGTSLYALRDIAYTIDKMKKSKKNIVVLGEEQKTYFKQISAALDILGYESPEALTYSYVLLSGGEKMSTRRGNVALLSDFMAEAVEKAKEEIQNRYAKITEKEIEKLAKIIGYGAVKYSMLRVSPDKNIIFDWDEALNFEGNSAPYLQYTYVRAKNIIEKAGKVKASKIKLEKQVERELIKKFSEFPAIIEEISRSYKVYLLANYIFETANLFNEFYEKCHVITEEDKELKATRIKIVKVYKKLIEKSLNLLGIEVPDFM
mgnify:CR=1 FL=1